MRSLDAMAISVALVASSAASRVEGQVQRVQTAADVVSAFERAGLPVQSVTVLNASSDSNHLLGRPGQYTSKVDFFDARHPGSDGGLHSGENTVEVFPTAAAARARHDYIEAVTRGVPILRQYLVLNGRVLARFDFQLLPSEVEEYRLALNRALPRR